LAERLDQQQKYFEERFERMERDRELAESLRESLKETQQQYQLQTAAAQEEKKKGFFARLFGK
jgi:RNA binding exosome subunit